MADCPAGQYAVVSDLEIHAAGPFSFFTCGDSCNPFAPHVAAITGSASTCFSMPATTPGLGDGHSLHIAVGVNSNTSISYALEYRVAYACTPLPTYSWVANAWSSCSATACGATGLQTRTFTCTASDAPASGPTPQSKCTAALPSTSQPCTHACSSGTAQAATSSLVLAALGVLANRAIGVSV